MSGWLRSMQLRSSMQLEIRLLVVRLLFQKGSSMQLEMRLLVALSASHMGRQLPAILQGTAPIALLWHKRLGTMIQGRHGTGCHAKSASIAKIG